MVQGLHQEEGRGALEAGPAQVGVGGSLWVGNDNPSHFLLILLRISFNLHWNAQWELQYLTLQTRKPGRRKCVSCLKFLP